MNNSNQGSIGNAQYNNYATDNRQNNTNYQAGSTVNNVGPAGNVNFGPNFGNFTQGGSGPQPQGSPPMQGGFPPQGFPPQPPPWMSQGSPYYGQQGPFQPQPGHYPQGYPPQQPQQQQNNCYPPQNSQQQYQQQPNGYYATPPPGPNANYAPPQQQQSYEPAQDPGPYSEEQPKRRRKRRTELNDATPQGNNNGFAEARNQTYAYRPPQSAPPAGNRDNNGRASSFDDGYGSPQTNGTLPTRPNTFAPVNRMDVSDNPRIPQATAPPQTYLARPGKQRATVETDESDETSDEDDIEERENTRMVEAVADLRIGPSRTSSEAPRKKPSAIKKLFGTKGKRDF